MLNGIVTSRKKIKLATVQSLTTNISNVQLDVLKSERPNCCRRRWPDLGSQGNYVVLNIEASYKKKIKAFVYTRNENVTE